MISLRVPGSYIDTAYPSARVGTEFFKGSGTSQAAAVVAGIAALMYEAKPSLTPDQVKQLLLNNAWRPVDADAAGAGKGQLAVGYINTQPVPVTTQAHTRSTGLGTLDGSRGTVRVTVDGVSLTGEKDIFGASFSVAAWAKASAAGTSWNGGTWMGTGWTGDYWTTVNGQRAWAGRAWSGRAWSGRAWSGRAWSSEAWLGQSWDVSSNG
jgi:serine protease AprX